MDGVVRGDDRDATAIVVGQRVTSEKIHLSRELRRQMTPAERTLWEALRAGRHLGLRFRRQQVIDGFIVDFYCHAAHLIVEVDGGIHEDQQGHDAARDQILAARGLRVIRFPNESVMNNLEHVLSQIAAAVSGGSKPD
jgi:very-short-patch-repair endonuclease